MGLCDTVEVLDEIPGLTCPEAHPLRAFRTKDVDEPSMCTYLVRGGRLYLARSSGRDRDDEDERTRWRIEEDEAVREHRFKLEEVGRRMVRVYGHCNECAPVLVRTDGAGMFGDIVQEHTVFVDFTLTFRAAEPVEATRTSGTRADLAADLAARGVYVLRDDEPLAVAHRELKKAREQQESRNRRRW